MSKPIGCALVAAVLFFIVMGPLFTIWSLNTLFGTNIPWSFKTWVAVVWLASILYGYRLSFKDVLISEPPENQS